MDMNISMNIDMNMDMSMDMNMGIKVRRMNQEHGHGNGGA